MKYLTQSIKSLILLLSCLALTTACGSLIGLDSDGNNSTLTSESNEEAMVTAAIESLNSTASSSESSSSSSTSSLTKGSSYLAAGSTDTTTSYATKHYRFRCDDVTSVYETFSCDNTTGTMSREVSFEDCELDDDNRPGTLNGIFLNTIENGGDGLCAGVDSIDFASMVAGRVDEDGIQQNAVHTHQIDEESPLVFDVTKTFKGEEIDGVITVTGSRQVTFTDAIDSNKDGNINTVNGTVVKTINRITIADNEEVHNVNVLTLEDAFTPLDEDGAELDEVALTYPVHALEIDEDGMVDTRTVTSGQLVIDRNHSDLRIVLSVGEEGLTFYPQDHCGPYEGTAIITGYTLGDDGNYTEVGSGEVVYADGIAQTSTYNGAELNLKPKPCS